MTSEHPDDAAADPSVEGEAHGIPPSLGKPADQPETSGWKRQEQAGSTAETPTSNDLAWLDEPAPSAEEQAARRARRERYKRTVRRRRRLRRAAVLGAVILGICLVLGFTWFRYVFGDIEHMPPVAGQAGASTPGTNLLVVGTNPAEELEDRGVRVDWRSDLVNSDLVMLVHLTADNSAAYVISIPGHSAVVIPGQRPGRLADAFKAGGAPLYVRTVEEMTGARLDRVITLDLNALLAITDELGGLDVEVPADGCDRAGSRHLDGQQALEHIALRECMARGDLDRVARQQSLLKAIMRSTVDGATLTNPFRVSRLAHALFSNTTLEEDFSSTELFSTLWSQRRLRTSDTMFLTVPTAARANFTYRGVNYVRLDRTKAADLWEALRTDRLAEYVKLSGIPTS